MSDDTVKRKGIHSDWDRESHWLMEGRSYLPHRPEYNDPHPNFERIRTLHPKASAHSADATPCRVEPAARGREGA
jgi:hypothetical protein